MSAAMSTLPTGGSGRRVMAIYDSIIQNLVFLALAVMVAASFIGVVARYLGRYIPGLPPVFWGEEVTRYTAQWMIYLVSGLAIRRGVHLGVDIFIAWLPKPLRLTVQLFSHALIVFLLLVLLRYGVEMTVLNMQQLSSALEIPMGYIYAAIPVGAVLMLIEEARAIYLVARGRPLRPADIEAGAIQ